ncbi:MAG: acyl-CoA-binding protein [Candidatus Riflebacteria bacterium]|nr:acyl-CoA-binding protein [Candidatus Riflebacteria bacterium]
MANLKKSFQKATEEVKSLDERPSDETMLKLYALYKQATAGDVSGARPGLFDLVGRAKYDAWAEEKGKTEEQAMQAYIDLVESLK